MQFENETNIKIHYETTGPEIWNALQGNVAAVFLCVGSCGTITGVGRALKERDPSIKIFGVDSHGSTVFGGKATPYFVQGGGLAFDPPLLDRKVVDEGIKVADQDAFNCGRQLAKEQGILLGGTASCAVHAARTRMSQFSAGDNVVVVVPDGGDRYLDNFYDKDWIEKRGFSFEEPLPFDAKIQATCEKYQCELHVA